MYPQPELQPAEATSKSFKLIILTILVRVFQIGLGVVTISLTFPLGSTISIAFTEALRFLPIISGIALLLHLLFLALKPRSKAYISELLAALLLAIVSGLVIWGAENTEKITCSNSLIGCEKPILRMYVGASTGNLESLEYRIF